MSSQYYDNIVSNLSKFESLYVLPYCFGIHEWKFIEEDELWVLYETHSNKTCVRCSVKDSKILTTETKKYTNTIDPNEKIHSKEVKIDGVIKALRKMDDTCFDGYCVLICDEHSLLFVSSFTCACAQIQLKHWILTKNLNFSSIMMYFDRDQNDDFESHYFFCKFSFYLFKKLSWMETTEDTMFKIFTEFLNSNDLII